MFEEVIYSFIRMLQSVIGLGPAARNAPFSAPGDEETE